MAASASLSLKSRSWSWIDSERGGRRSGDFLQFKKEKRIRALELRNLKRSKNLELKMSCCCSNRNGEFTPDKLHASNSEALILEAKGKDVLPNLNARCIYLVGMMGSGKTTVGKIISEVLGYAFIDSDAVIERTVGASSVAQIFKEHSEAFFRDNESKVLRDLSSMRRLVVATGGGAVIRPINWRYMKQGISIWLDVPLEVLARRIAAVGTDSRPLLHEESGDPYTKAFVRLTALSEQRGKAYANADARVSLEYLANEQGHEDVTALTPMAIAIEALERIEIFMTEKEHKHQKNSSYLQG